MKFLTEHQHGFVRKRSVTTNKLSFLQKIYEALDRNSNDDITIFYSDFSKAFDKVPHKKLHQKVSQMGVGGCLLDVLYDYVEDRKQFVRADNISSKVLSITSGVPQGSLLGPLLLCIFINDLPDVLRFSEPYLFADDLKILAVGHSQSDVQIDIDAVDSWVRTNHVELAINKCSTLKVRGTEKKFHLAGKPLKTDSEIEDHGITVDKSISWTAHKQQTEKN